MTSKIPIQEILLVGGGALVTHLWNRFRGRLARLRWSMQYTRIAVSAQDANFGNIEVRYNDRRVHNLHTANLQVQNESARDLSDLTINIACLDGSFILVSQGSLVGGLQQLPFTPEFNQSLQRATGTQANNLDQQTLNYLTTRRDYVIPVLNRGQTANFLLLVERNDVNQPNLTVNCEHAGVRMIHRAPAIILFGENQLHGTLIGLTSGLIVVTVLIILVTSGWLLGFVAWLVGCSGAVIGVLLIKLWRRLSHLLS